MPSLIESCLKKLINKFLFWLRITQQPVIKAYDGYGDNEHVIVYGHVFSVSPVMRKTFRRNVILNFFWLIRMFIVIPKKNARVIIEWNGESHETKTEGDGLFKCEWNPINQVTPGWQEAKVSFISPAPSSVVLATTYCSVFIPHKYQYNFISDIDDTFLISHSNNLRKRLFVLVTKNARTRKPFEGVVNHYRLLSMSGVSGGIPNPFFYVSSSEWNLYDYIKEFCRKEEMPRGVFLLNQIKKLKDLLKTGQNNHSGKYVRIARILKSYPNHKYVLLGDNSQADPEIYFSIVRDFPGKIYAVYLRNISPKKEKFARDFIAKIECANIHCCYFVHSSEAIKHSRSIGLISPE